MTSRRTTIESLSLELERLSIVSENIRRTIAQLERGEDHTDDEQAPRGANEQQDPQGPRVVDRDGTIITIGCEVTFLTRGRFRTTGGTVTRFSHNNARVFAIDTNGIEIPRAPRNVRVLQTHQ